MSYLGRRITSTQTRAELIYVHVPKTGGTSLRTALQKRYGDRLVLDYGDLPMDPASPMNVDPDGFLKNQTFDHFNTQSAIMGHFWIRKYDRVDARRAVLLREPIERAISLYYFWIAADRIAPVANSLVRYVIDHKLDFMQFAHIPNVRWSYTKVFFRDVDMARFDYIGDQASLSRDWHRTVANLGFELQPERTNQTIEHDPHYLEAQQELLNDAKKMATLRDLFADDTEFFHRHVTP